MSLFQHIHDRGEDQIFGLQTVFKNDTRLEKVNLTLGVFVTEDGVIAPVLDVVKEAERFLLDHEETKTYLPIDGDHVFVGETGKLIFGKHYSDRIYGMQTVGGTSALRILFEFFRREISHLASVSHPTWPNHLEIIHGLDYQVDQHSYGATFLDFEHIKTHIAGLTKNTILLLQPSCHNPTGNDLNREQWETISDLCYEKKLIPFFDCAYQGLGRGFEEDVGPIRLFYERGHEMLVSYSFSKSMGLYNERVGAAYVVTKDCGDMEKLKRSLRMSIRTMYSNPPNHGAAVAKKILSDDGLKASWEGEVGRMRKRVQAIREILADLLTQKAKKDHYGYIRTGHGFFAMLDLSKEAIQSLRDEKGIYLTKNGRINLAGLNPSNIEYVAEAVSQHQRHE